MESIVYTAITGNYELPRTDIKVFTESLYDDPQRGARMYKCLPPKSVYSLWIDGNTSLKVSIEYLIEKYLTDYDMCVFKHPIRDCIYDEAETCKILKLDDVNIIDGQMQRYRVEGFPEHYGLVASGYVLRRHTPKIEEFNNLWWSEICKGSKRDQLSFNYCCWKLGIKYNTFTGDHYDNFKYNDYFNYRKHGE